MNEGYFIYAAAAKSLQSCPTLCNPIDGSPPGSSVHGIFQARVLEWGATAFSVIYAKLSKIINNIFKSMNWKAKDKHYLINNSVQKRAFG